MQFAHDASRQRHKGRCTWRTNVGIFLWLVMKSVNFTFFPSEIVGRNSVVRIRTRYGLDGQWIEYRWERGFAHPSRWALGSTQSLQNGYQLSSIQSLQNGYQLPFPGVKLPGRGVNHPSPSSSEVKERVKLYVYWKIWNNDAKNAWACAVQATTAPVRNARNILRKGAISKN
jgi:hypothetical protein